MIRHNGLPIHLKWKGKPLFLCLLFDPSNPERISTQKSSHHCFIKKQIPYIHGKSRKRGVGKRGNIGQALEMVQNRLLAQYGGERSRTNLSRLLRSDHTFM